ncbi:hypothetical protein PTKIN_Ptkin14bG0056400 [Pterospermum kingtungense]
MSLLFNLSNLDFEFDYVDDHLLLSNLDLEFCDDDDDDYNEHFLEHRKHKSSALKSFVTFVDNMMFLHNETSIEKFRLKCSVGLDPYLVYSWISAALWRGVQHLDLDVYVTVEFTMPRVLFTSKTLVTLKLCTGSNMNIPRDVCFPCLKTLHLHRTSFVEEDSIKRLFSSCISLEDMVIEECCVCSGVTNFNISHHLLKKLTTINLRVPVFPNLVQLKIWYDHHLPSSMRGSYSRKKGVAGSLLSCFPKLEKLAFCQEVFNYIPEEVPFCLSCKLKAVEISEFEAGKKWGIMRPKNGQWGAQLYANHNLIWLGTFKSEKDAAMAYDTAAIKFRTREPHRNFAFTDVTVEEPKFLSHFSDEAVLSMIRDGL